MGIRCSPALAASHIMQSVSVYNVLPFEQLKKLLIFFYLYSTKSALFVQKFIIISIQKWNLKKILFQNSNDKPSLISSRNFKLRIRALFTILSVEKSVHQKTPASSLISFM